MNRVISRYLLLLFGLFSLLPVEFFAQSDAETERVYLSGKDRFTTVEWDFYCSEGRNSGEWTKIKVPSNWELENFGTYNYGHDHKEEDRVYGREFGEYEHRFRVPQEWEGKQVNIVFEGAMTDTEVRINSSIAGPVHQGGFYQFKYDISKFVRYGKRNDLNVKVHKVSANESVQDAERHADYWIFGGIYRPVYLEVLPALHLERTAVNAQADGSLILNAFTNRTGADKISLTLIDQNGNAKGKSVSFDINKDSLHHELSTSFENVETWSPEFPNLYTLKIELFNANKLIHLVNEKIGFRTVKLVPNDGIYVNGEKIVMKGVNRHSFYPTSGRCLSDKDHIEDVNLMKDMNMNAVRMSHYPPDQRFLEICDSLGLFVLDELGGWQKYGYDTIVGPKLIEKLILRDENHPSVIVWDFGNEGGWQFPNEKWFHFYDFQKRPVIYPWLRRNNTDTRHYPSWDILNTRLTTDDQIFFPTELLHGIYDGGHGANLNDYWEAAKLSPVNAGGFLWNLRDEAVWRTDLLKFDADGNHAPDGIVGPHGEKEGSFYTVKEIWSPVQVSPFVINKDFNGNIVLRNEFIYTDLDQCKFNWRLVEKGNSNELLNKVVASGSLNVKSTVPGTSTKTNIPLPSDFMNAEVLELEVIDPHGREIYTWRWPIKRAEDFVPELIENLDYKSNKLQAKASGNTLTVKAGKVTYEFDLENGKLSYVENESGKVSFSGGPTPVGYDGPNGIKSIEWDQLDNGKVILTGAYESYPNKFQWTIHENGLLELEADQLLHSKDSVAVLGLSFNYPESKMNGFRWMGDGPYRVYKNRLKGATFGVWEKKYNNTITGQSFDSLIYPEFKGYHADLYWAAFDTDESDFKVYCKSPDIYLKMYTPPTPEAPRDANVIYPEGDIAFLHYIPAIGTKFQNLQELGPSAQLERHSWRTGDVFKTLKLVFDFHDNIDLNIGYNPVPDLPENMPFEFNTDVLPKIPKQEFLITDFLAKEDGNDISKAVKEAIHTAYLKGGGRVIVPKGKWNSGPIHLKSKIDLHLAEGSEIYFSDRLEDYLPAVRSRHQGIDCYKYSSFIYANNETNIALTGTGLLHGQGEKWKGYNEYKEVGWGTLVKMVADNVPVNERIFNGKTDTYIPPFFVSFINCKKILVEDVKIQYGAFWTLVPIYCEDILIRNVEITTRSPEYQVRNGDGIVPNSSKNVWVDNCTLNTGDDCFVLKSGRAEDGIRVNRPTEKVVIQNCVAKQGHGGVVFGSEMSGGIKDVLVDNCVFDGTDLGLRFKTARGRGAYVKDIYIRNIEMKNIPTDAIRINMLRYTHRYPAFELTERTPYYDNINIENVTGSDVQKHAINLTGLPERMIKNVTFKNVSISSSLGLIATDSEDITFDNVLIESENYTAFDLDNCHGFKIKNSKFKAITDTRYVAENCGNIEFDNTEFINKKISKNEN